MSRATLEDIAEAAGVTRGAFYWHFRNKADLFQAMMQRVMLPLEDMRATSAGDDDPLAQIRACALAVLLETVVNEHRRRVFEIIYHKCEYVDDMAQLRERHLQGRAECLAYVEGRFRSASEKGLLKGSVDPRRAAVAMHAMIDGLLSNWVLDPCYLPLETDAAHVVDGFLNGLRAGSGAEKAVSQPVTTVRRRGVAVATTKSAKSLPASRAAGSDK